IFPTRGGELVSLDAGAVIPGDFTLPSIGGALTQLELGEDNRWRSLFIHLGVPVLERAAFIENHLLVRDQGLNPGEQLKALRWLRDNLSSAVSEREAEGDAESFLEAVYRTPFIRCEDGECRPAANTYDPSASSVRELLGPAAAFPDVAYYATGIERWLP